MTRVARGRVDRLVGWLYVSARTGHQPTMMIATPTASIDARLSAVRIWLWSVVALVVVMITVGGATRLTGSGLSITEWRPVAGAIPPLSREAWALAFSAYQKTPQYELLNRGMTLGDFQFIYWWEWSHRQLGRFIGALYLGGFVWAAVTRRVDKRTGVFLLAMGVLLGLQGAVGWIMVASGLEPGMTAVAPIKLTLHLGLACLFLMSLLAMLCRLGALGMDPEPATRGAWLTSVIFLSMVFVQILLGGLVAGSKAGLTFNTWPLMDGAFAPSSDALLAVSPWWENFVDNPALVQLNHRVMAYLLLGLATWQVSSTRGTKNGAIRRRAGGLLKIVLTQAILGIATLLYVVPLPLGLAHQLLAVILLGFATRHAALTWRGQRSQADEAATGGISLRTTPR
jgi:cytochrome c oxidase assembly protein subunit 15